MFEDLIELGYDKGTLEAIDKYFKQFGIIKQNSIFNRKIREKFNFFISLGYKKEDIMKI